VSLEDHGSVFKALEDVLALSLDPAVSMLVGAVQGGGKILSFGPLSQYMSTQFLNPQFHEAIPCLCLHDIGTYTPFIKSGDAAVIICPDDNPVDISAVWEARRMGAMTLGLTHAKGMRSKPDVEIRVPSMNAHRVIEAHLYVIHALLEGCKAGIRSFHAA
jgi:phosphoheptose isomerase